MGGVLSTEVLLIRFPTPLLKDLHLLPFFSSYCTSISLNKRLLPCRPNCDLHDEEAPVTYTSRPSLVGPDA